MKVILIACIFLLTTSSVLARFEWDQKDVLKLNLCGFQTKHDKINCENEYYAQLYYRMDVYLKDSIKYQFLNSLEKYSQEEYCESPSIQKIKLDAYEKEQKSWFDYLQNRCEVSSSGMRWGKGDGNILASCIKALSNESVRQAERYLISGFSVIECGTPGNQGLNPEKFYRMKLETDNFNIVLESSCQRGFFDCENIYYFGTNKKTGDSISLKGTPLYSKAFNEQTHKKMSYQRQYLHTNLNKDGEYSYFNQVGYLFKNGGYSYKIFINGDLVVEDNAGKKILHESGEWKGFPKY